MKKGWEWRYDFTMAKEPKLVRGWKRKSGGKYYEAFEQGFYDELFGVDTKYLHLKPGSSAEAGEPFATLAVEVSGHPPTTNIRAS